VWLRRVNKRNGCRENNSSGDLLALEVWKDFRPYLRALLVDFSISISQWLCGFIFQKITNILAIKGLEGAIILAVHSANMALAFGTFGVLFTLDVIAIRKAAHLSY